MEDIKLNEFIGNKNTVSFLKKWAKNNYDNKNFPKRFCFLTGNTGCGKSLLARLVLKNTGFNVKIIDGSCLRIKTERESFYKVFRFSNVISLINETNPRKAIIIENFENMALGTQKIFKKLQLFLKKKQSFGIPIIFTGNKSFRNKKPLPKFSLFLRLYVRGYKEIRLIIKQILKKKFPQLINIKNEKIEELTIKCNGDIRQIINYFNLFSLQERNECSAGTQERNECSAGTQERNECSAGTQDNNKNPNLEINIGNKSNGPLFCLYRIMKNKNLSINEVFNELSIESMLTLGLNSTYITYVLWYLKNNKKFDMIHYYKTIKEMSLLFHYYNLIKEFEKKYQEWELDQIANIIPCYGFSKILNNYDKKQPIIINKKEFNREIINSHVNKNLWWFKLENYNKKNIKFYENEPIQSILYNKFIRGILNQNQKTEYCFKKSCKPSNISFRIILDKMNISKK